MEKKAEEITKLINPDNDSSDDEDVTVTKATINIKTEPQDLDPSPKIPFWVR